MFQITDLRWKHYDHNSQASLCHCRVEWVNPLVLTQTGQKQADNFGEIFQGKAELGKYLKKKCQFEDYHSIFNPKVIGISIIHTDNTF